MHYNFLERAYGQSAAYISLPHVLAVLGAILWIVAYVIFMIRGYRDRASPMPLVAVCLNITWEFVYVFIWPPVVPIMRPIRMAWLALDAVILWQVFRWGSSDHPGVIARHFGFVVTAALLLALAGHIGFADSFNGIDPCDRYADGHYEAYLLNLVMSILFCLFVLKREPGLRGISFWGGVAKMAGTGMYSIAATLIYIEKGKLVDGLLLPLLFVSILLFDLLYLVLVRSGRARGAALALRHATVVRPA